MAGTRARVSIVGHLGSDPETGQSSKGVDYSRFSVAVGGKDKDQAPQWFQVAAFHGLSQVASDYLRKGNLVLIEGDLSIENWEDKQGNPRTSAKVVAREMLMLGGNANGNGGNRHDDSSGGSNRPRQAANSPYRNGQNGNRSRNQGDRKNGDRNRPAGGRRNQQPPSDDYGPGDPSRAGDYADQGPSDDDVPW